MKNIFKKSDLPLIDKAVHSKDAYRDQVDLYYKIRVEEGFVRHIATEVMLLERAAVMGDGYAVWELAQHYYYDESVRCIPIALSWWKRAILMGNTAACDRYREHREYILSMINSYSEGMSDYADLELRLAMLAEIYLFELGTVDWKRIADSERLDRVRRLADACVPLLGVKFTGIEAISNLTFAEPGGKPYIVHALAYPDHHIALCREMMADAERLVAVIFHELGHFVCFRAMGDSAYAEKWGLTPERIASWHRGDMGYEVKTSEEDPDTLSYGVYTHWAILFAEKK